MNEYIAQISLDLNCNKTPIVLASGQYDKGRKIAINITADGSDYDVADSTAVCKGIRSDGSHFAVECPIIDNKVVFNTEESTFAVRGKTTARIVLTDGTKTYSTQSFVVLVSSAFDGDISSVENYSILNNLIERVVQITSTGGILIDNELNEESTNPLSNLAVTLALAKKLNDIDSIIETRHISKNAITTDKILMENITTTKIAPKAVTNSKIADSAITEEKIAGNAITTYKIVEGAVDRSRLALNSVSTSRIADDNVTLEKLSASVRNAINSIPNKAEGSITYFTPISSKLFNLGARYQIDSSTNTVTYKNNIPGWQSTLLNCQPGDVLKVTAYIPTGYNVVAAVIFMTENEGTFNFVSSVGLGGSNEINFTDEVITVPEGVTQVAFNTYRPNSTIGHNLYVDKQKTDSLSDEVLSVIKNPYSADPLYGKKLYVDGDSIAQGEGSYGVSFGDIIAKNHNMILTKEAVGGTTLAVRTNRTDSIYERITTALNGEYDYILLDGGMNDLFFINEEKFGEVSSSFNYDDFDETTTCGALEKICSFLIKNYLESKVTFVLTHRKNDVYLVKAATTIEYTEKQRRLWDKLIAVLNKWGIPYVDLSMQTSLSAWDAESANKYFAYSEDQEQGDGTHPTRSTYEIFYVPLIEAKLKNLG